MNTDEDWKRERDLDRSCRRCDGRGWVIDRNAPSGGSPCGCDESQEDDPSTTGTEQAQRREVSPNQSAAKARVPG